MQSDRKKIEPGAGDRGDQGDPGAILRVKDVARILNVSDRTVKRVIERGKLAAFQLGGPGTALLIPRESVDRLIANEIREFQLRNGVDGMG